MHGYDPEMPSNSLSENLASYFSKFSWGHAQDLLALACVLKDQLIMPA